MEELAMNLSVKNLLQKFSSRQVTCKEFAHQVIQHKQEYSEYNFYSYFDEQQLIKQAEASDQRYDQGTARPLEGLPVSFKDNINIEGEPNTGGTPAFWNRKPMRTSTLARILLDNGAIRAGRTVMDELAWGITSNNFFTGPPRNPFNKEYSCGGSSGGSGAAVGAGIVPCAIGTDTGGSIRIPASSCGVFGYKPTIGRWPAGYGIKISHLRDTIGPMVRDADDLAILDQAVTKESPLDPPSPNDVRIVVPRKHFWDDLHPEIEDKAEEFVRKLKEAGFQVLDCGNDIELKDIQDFKQKTNIPSAMFEFYKRIEDHIMENNYDDLTVEKVIKQIKSPDIAAVLQEGLKNPVSTESWETVVIDLRRKMLRSFDDYFEKTKADVIIFPTLKIPAQKLVVDCDVEHNGKKRLLSDVFTENVNPASLINYPGITMPLGKITESGVPFGIEIDTYTYNDRKLIAVSRSIQNAIGKITF